MTFEEAVNWLSETFDWDAAQTGEFLRDLAAEAFDKGYMHCADTQCANCYSCGSHLGAAINPYRGGAA